MNVFLESVDCLFWLVPLLWRSFQLLCDPIFQFWRWFSMVGIAILSRKFSAMPVHWGVPLVVFSGNVGFTSYIKVIHYSLLDSFLMQVERCESSFILLHVIIQFSNRICQRDYISIMLWHIGQKLVIGICFILFYSTPFHSNVLIYVSVSLSKDHAVFLTLAL